MLLGPIIYPFLSPFTFTVFSQSTANINSLPAASPSIAASSCLIANRRAKGPAGLLGPVHVHISNSIQYCRQTRPIRRPKLALSAFLFRPSLLPGIHSLFPFIFFFLNANIYAQNDQQGEPIARFQSGQQVQGIVTANSLLAVLFTDNSLALFHKNSTTMQKGKVAENWTKLWEIQLETNEALTDLQMPSNSNNEQFLLICFITECRICPISAQPPSPPSIDKCQFHKFDQPVQSLKAAVTSEGRLFLRPIYSPRNAAIQAIDQRNGRLQAVDYSDNDENRVFAGFHRGDYVYFVGSAKRVDLVYRVDIDAHDTKWRTDVRLSRICEGDNSRIGVKGLESRMELILSCKGLDDDHHRNPPTQRAIGASQSGDGKSLLVAIEREEKADDGHGLFIRNLVCRFGMDELDAAFDNLWDTCQTVRSSKYSLEECKGQMEKPECFMFSWEQDEDRYSLCRRFGPIREGQPPLGNCQLNSTETKQFRLGWLENFNPTFGQIVAELPATLDSPLVEMRESASGESFLLAFENGTIQRFPIDNANIGKEQLAIPLWTIQTEGQFGPFGMALDPSEKGNLLYANSNEIHSLGMDCAGMYPKCEQIVWTDPLQCIWCHFPNSTGKTMSRSQAVMEECHGGFPLMDSCPPAVTEVSREENGMLTIWGNRLDKMDQPKITFCGHQCQLDRQTATTIRCKMVSIPSNECQTLSLKGQFGSISDFAVNHDLSKDGKLDENDRHHQSYIYRVLFVIVAILLMLIALIVIYCSLYPKYARRLLKLAFFRSGRNGNGGDSATYRPIPSSTTDFITNPIQNAEPFAGHPSPWRSAGCHHSNSHTLIHDGIFGIENLVVTLADGSQLDQGTFQCIGEGYFSKVCRAICRRGPEEEKGYFVAVKIIKNASSLAEIRQEVAMISKCRHPNIVQYIDHFVSELGLIHIVIEYMGGGDLHRFLMNWKNMPTIGDAFSYILQIADGMSYLTEQRIVHRDLAARNCMLDSDYQIVKITDFGLSRVLTKSKLMGEENSGEENYVYIYLSGNQQQQLPYRWTAIECFCADPLFSEKTDVWAFGVLVWEIFARNRVPYGEMKSQEVKKFLETGGRLEQQMHCPRELYEMMKQCWSADPSLRPAFNEIRLRVQRIFDELMAQDAEYMKTQYEPLAGTEYEAPRPSVSGSAGPINATLSSTATTIAAPNNSAL